MAPVGDCWHPFNEAKTQEAGRVTAWAAYNAIKEWPSGGRRISTSQNAARSVLEEKAAEIRLRALKFYDPEVKPAA